MLWIVLWCLCGVVAAVLVTKYTLSTKGKVSFDDWLLAVIISLCGIVALIIIFVCEPEMVPREK